MSRYVALDVGCAECGDMPLVALIGTFDDIDEAKAACPTESFGEWQPHPQGGEFRQSGSGSVAVLPLEFDEAAGGVASMGLYW